MIPRRRCLRPGTDIHFIPFFQNTDALLERPFMKTEAPEVSGETSFMSSICVTGRFPGTLRDDMTDGCSDTSPSLLLLSLPPCISPSPVTSRSASCGIREMIKEDSFKYLSRLSLMASQSRWAPRWQEESVRMTGGDWGEGKYSSFCVEMSVYLCLFTCVGHGST